MTNESQSIIARRWFKDLPLHWDIRPLSELIAEFIDNRGKTAPTSELGIPLIATNCIKNDWFYPKKENVRFVSEKTFRTWFRSHPKPGDIIIVNKGTPGLVCMVPDPVDFCFAQDMIAIRANRDFITSEYLFAVLRSPYFLSQVDAFVVGTTVAHLKKTDFSRLFVPLPPLREQKIIGKLYCNFCRLIEKNNEINILLEKICALLFAHWFIDFEFPGENGKPYKSNFGKMQDSELGDIPTGWTTAQIRNCGTIICGKTPPTSERDYYGTDLPFITIPDMRNQTFVVKTARGLSLKGGNSQKKAQLPSLSICVSCIATPGLVALTSQTSHTNQQINSIICNADISPFFMYYAMLNLDEKIRVLGSGGTATLNLNKTDFERLAIIVPPNIIMRDFHRIVAPLFKQILSTERQNIKLSRIRDALLSKFLSGQLTLPKNNENDKDELRDSKKSTIQKKLLNWPISSSS